MKDQKCGEESDRKKMHDPLCRESKRGENRQDWNKGLRVSSSRSPAYFARQTGHREAGAGGFKWHVDGAAKQSADSLFNEASETVHLGSHT